MRIPAKIDYSFLLIFILMILLTMVACNDSSAAQTEKLPTATANTPTATTPPEPEEPLSESPTTTPTAVFVDHDDTPIPPQPTTNPLADFFNTLQPWDSGEQPASDEPQQRKPSQDEPEITLNVEKIAATGEVTEAQQFTYNCRTTPYSVTRNPEEVVMYGSVNSEILWPGALIQGKSHRDNDGDLLGLSLDGNSRAPLTVIIPDINGSGVENVVIIQEPTKGAVQAAISEMVGNSVAQNLQTPSSIAFSMETFHSEEEFALKIGISGRYLNFSGSAKGEYEQDASETTIAVHFYQKMYEVVVEPPATPEALFSPTFTLGDMKRQQALGRIGVDNQPLLVSKVVYGRMMMFTMTSTASEEAMRGTLQAAYDGVVSEADFELTTEQKRIMESAEIKVTWLGGNADNTLAVIRSGKWDQYFTENAALSTAAPLSYVFRNVQNGSVADVYETTEYSVRTCAEVSDSDTFVWLPAQQLGLPIEVPAKPYVGDVNGDGLADVVWMHLVGRENQIVVGLATGAGTFAMHEPLVLTDKGHGWGTYEVVIADVNGDGSDDIILNHITTMENVTYIGLSQGDGNFAFLKPQRIEWARWHGGKLVMGDVDGNGRFDLIWNSLSSPNRILVALAQADGTLDFQAVQEATNLARYEAQMGDVNGDGLADLIWAGANRLTREVVVGLSNGDGTFTYLHREQAQLDDGSGQYKLLVGDVDGNGRSDLIWNALTRTNHTYIDTANLDGTFRFQDVRQTRSPSGWSSYTARLGDMNGDGRADLIWNVAMAGDNRTYTSPSLGNGLVDLVSRPFQDHPDQAEWGQFELLLGDVNGDGKTDVIWNHASTDNPVYVGLAR